MMETNVITGEIVRGAMKGHTALGPGLLESIYRRCLAYELTKSGLRVIQEKPIQIMYDGVQMGTGLRLDLMVEESVIVEVKGGGKNDRTISVATSVPFDADSYQNRSSHQLQR